MVRALEVVEGHEVTSACVCVIESVGTTSRPNRRHHPRQRDKVTSQRLRAAAAVIHLCKEETCIKEGLRQDSRRQRRVMQGGSDGWRIKRTLEITKAFERQVQYRRRVCVGGGVRNEGGRLEEMTKERKIETGYWKAIYSHKYLSQSSGEICRRQKSGRQAASGGGGPRDRRRERREDNER